MLVVGIDKVVSCVSNWCCRFIDVRVLDIAVSIDVVSLISSLLHVILLLS